MKYKKWLDKYTESLEGKTVLVLGATGSIGYEIVRYLAYLKANIIIGARSKEKCDLLLNRINREYPYVEISFYNLDISEINNINVFIELLGETKLDFVINTIGTYQRHSQIINNHEIHYMTNYIGVSYLLDKLIEQNNASNMKIINTGSIAYRFVGDITEPEGVKRSAFKQYSISKKLLMIRHFYLKNNSNLALELAHPGICATNLFQTKSKAFKIFILPLMKLLFMHPEKASLSILYAMFVDTEGTEWIGPRGLFHIWGYPKVYKVKKNILKDEVSLEANNLYLSSINDK